VRTLMHAGAALPLKPQGTRMSEAIIEMTAKGFGCVGIVAPAGDLIGIITDGDLRRQMERGVDIRGLTAADVMTRGPVSVAPSILAVEALNIMEARKITSIVVVDQHSSSVAGVVHLHDLWGTEMF